MFKRLRERISEEASKSVAQLGNNAIKTSSESDNKVASGNSSEDLITLSESSSIVMPHSSSQQFSIGEDDEGSMSEQSTPQKNADASNGSTPYSTPSSVGTDFSFSQEYRPKRLSYIPQSDIESEREDPPTLNLEGISKDQLLSVIDLLKARTHKYKNKYSEVVKNFKELRDEKLKIEKTLIDTQDKGSRRIAELREQCQLEQKAKAHLEANLRLMLEEKDNRISVLETQINLLKDTDKSDNSSHTDSDRQSLKSTDLLTGDSTLIGQDCSDWQEKFERLEHQFNQAKKTITAQTDQITLLRKQNENLSQELEGKAKRVNELEDQQINLKQEHESVLKSMQIRLEELENQQEESAMAMAETKKNMHEELELKEKQLIKAKTEASQHQSTVESERRKVAELQKHYEDKINELQRQLESTEKTLEDEKQNLMQELARGKTAAIALMQKDCAQKISAVEEEWKSKLQQLQSQLSEASDEEKSIYKMKEKLNQSEIQVKELNSLVLQLEKENVSLKSSFEKLKSEFDCRTAEYETLQVSYNDLDYLRKKEFSNYEGKLNELNIQIKLLNKKVNYFQNIERENQDSSLLLKEQLEQKQCLVDALKNNENELKMKIDHLENEVKVLTALSQELQLKLEEIKLTENIKLKEISELQEYIKLLKSNESITKETILKNAKYVDDMGTENKTLISNIAFLNDEVSKIRNQLQESESNRLLMEAIIQEAKLEIENLHNCLTEKQESLIQYQENFTSIESSVLSFEKEHFKLKKNLKRYELAFNKLFRKYNYIYKSLQNVDKECKKCETESLEDVVIIKELENKIRDTFNPDVVSKSNKITQEIGKGKSPTKNVENSEAQKLIEDLVKENANLRRELHDIKELSDIQNIESAKDITELQKSLNDLSEERNNLSLVLKSIEAHSIEINPEAFQNHSENLKGKMSVDIVDNKSLGAVAEINIMELNVKVKSEIEALSNQTELINHELRFLQEQFNSSRTAFSEKLHQLNSKLLRRTEMLIRTKDDLDASLENAENLKDLLENMRKQFDERKEVLEISQKEKKDLENKLKLLKDKHIKKELELKQNHNVQLSDLKNQTKVTIDKLNEELMNANKSIKIKEEELKSVFQLKCTADRLFASKKEFENQFFSSIALFDSYFSRVEGANSKLMSVSSKLKEKDQLIQDLLSQIEKLKNQISINDMQLMKNQLVSVTDEVDILNKELESEKNIKKLLDADIIVWKEKFEKAIEELETVSASAESKENLHKSSILDKQSELEVVIKKNAELTSNVDDLSTNLHKTSAELLNLQKHCSLLEDQLQNTIILLEKEKSSAQLESKSTSEYKNMYDNILSLTTSSSFHSYEHLGKIITALNETEVKLKALEVKIPQCAVKLKSLESSKLLSQKWCHQIEKCLCFLEESDDLKISTEEIYLNNCELETTVESLEAVLQKLIDKVNMKMKVFVTQAEDLTIANSRVQELEAKYNASQNHLQLSVKELEDKTNQMCIMTDEFDDHKNKCCEKISEINNSVVDLQSEVSMLLEALEEKDNMLQNLEMKSSEMVSTDELEVCQQKYNSETKDLNDKFNSEIKQLNDNILSLEKHIKGLQKVVKEKENIIKNLENQLSAMIPANEFDKCKQKYSIETQELNDKFSVEIKLLKDVTLSQESEIKRLLKVIEEREDTADNLQIQLAAMISGEEFDKYKETCSTETKELNDKFSSEIKQLKNTITSHENEIKELLKVIEDKQIALKNFQIQLALMIPNEEFVKCKQIYSDEIKKLKDNFSTEILQLKDSIVNHESEIDVIKKEKESLIKTVKDKTDQINSMVSKEEFEECMHNCKELTEVITKLQNEITELKTVVEEKKSVIQKIQAEQKNSDSKNEESIKCLKDKYGNAEKNYTTQMDEMKQRISILEKEKQALDEENKNFNKVQEELLEKKSKLKSQNEEMRKEHLEKVERMQEKVKHQESTVLKLEAELESLAKESSEKLEASKKKIKLLEQEREQLMHEAQERVSATEAKCREDLKLLQTKNDKLSAGNKEIELLRTKIISLEKNLQENLKFIESFKAESSEKASDLKRQLSEMEEKLIKVEAEKQVTVNELLEKLQKFEADNSHLVNKATLLEDLKSEKEALNEKLKQAEIKTSSLNYLEVERDNLKLENASILEQLQLLKSSMTDQELLTSQTKSLEETIENCTNNSKLLEKENSKLKGEIGELRKSLDKEVTSLKAKNESLSKQIDLLEKLDSSDPSSVHVKNYIASVRQECEKAIKAKEEDMESKLKLLVRDFAEQMDIKDRDCDKMTSEILERNHGLEERLTREHRNEIVELQQNLFEKECALDDIRDDYEVKLQEKDKKIKEYESVIKNLSSSESGISPDSALLTAESSDWDDTWVVPEETVESNARPPAISNTQCDEHVQEIETLKDELSKCNSEIKELKVLLRLSPPESMVNNNNRRDSLQSIPEPTEFEYLKNIIYEYMMGKEPITLVKVIAAVLRFSEVQTQQVIRKEESRHQTK